MSEELFMFYLGTQRAPVIFENLPGEHRRFHPAVHGCGSCRTQVSRAGRVAAMVFSCKIVPSD
jgi:hypothetical protein